MEDNYTTENEDNEAATEESGSMTFDGEAWKDREDVTYTSLLDMYSAENLFSSENMELYKESEQAKQAESQELIDYVFSGYLNTGDNDAELIDYIFSEKIELSNVKDYSRNENDYFVCYVMAAVLVALIFVCLLINFNSRRKIRRGKYATEIDLED